MNGCNETVATLIGIGIGLLAAYVFIPQIWTRILKVPCTRLWAKVKAVYLYMSGVR